MNKLEKKCQELLNNPRIDEPVVKSARFVWSIIKDDTRYTSCSRTGELLKEKKIKCIW